MGSCLQGELKCNHVIRRLCNISDEKVIEVEGWGYTNVSRKWHYFQFKKGENLTDSLCGKIGFYGAKDVLEQGNDNSVDNCSECKKRLIKNKGELKP